MIQTPYISARAKQNWSKASVDGCSSCMSLCLNSVLGNRPWTQKHRGLGIPVNSEHVIIMSSLQSGVGIAIVAIQETY